MTASPSSSANLSPIVSVLVSTYASEKFLRACLEDLEAQTIAHQIEIIVIDSGSPENERDIVEEFQKRYSNIRYVRTERETLYAAWNRGVQMARGKYVTNANSDDSHRADALELLVAALETNPEADLSYGDYYTTQVPNDTFASPSPMRLVQHPPYHPALLHFYCFTGCHPMWRRTVFDKIGLFDTQYIAPGDYEFLLRFAAHGLRAVHVPQPISLFFQNPDGLSFKSRERSEREFHAIQKQYRADLQIERWFKIDPADNVSAARGWAALGNSAMSFEAPWFDNVSQDVVFAMHCYQTALRLDAHNAAARLNLVLATALHGSAHIEKLLAQLPLDEARRAKNAITSGCFELIAMDVPPAAEALEYGRVDSLPRPADRALPPNAAVSKTVRSPVRWLGSFFDCSETASAARALVPALADRVTLGALDRSVYAETVGASLPSATRESLRDCFRRYPFLRGGVTLSHGPAIDFQTPPDTSLRVGWTSFPFRRVPARWVSACQQMDEIWVPNTSQLEAFAEAGVPRSRLAVMPTPVDENVFDPAAHEPWPLPKRARCNFLALVDSSRSSGWDVLLSAFTNEFSAKDDVCLYLAPETISHKTDLPALEKQLRNYIQTMGVEEKNRPRVEWLGSQLLFADRPRLYRAVDCFVSPRRGDDWNLYVLEAMAMARAVIATNRSERSGLVNASHALPLSFEFTPMPSDAAEWIGVEQEWVNPSEPHLRELLRRVVQEPDQMRWLGYRAREYVQAHHSSTEVAELVAQRLHQLERGAPATELPDDSKVACTDNSAVNIAWEGTFRDLGSLSHVNRELTRQLAGQSNVTLTCVHSEEKSSLKTSADITVRHEWPPRWQRPASGAWVLIQPWEFGALPADWVRELKNVDEVWAPSEYARRVYLDSGVPASKVKVVPNGIDPERFHPKAAPYALPTRKRFKFLFVGGTIQRKGADVLLETFVAQFTAEDDVCIVIKDFGGQGIYAGQTLAPAIRAAQQKAGAPEIIHLTNDLSAEQIAGLYTACDCLVHPYRGEGFALPVLEAMACGLPVIVTAGGATDDFATDEWAYRIPAARKPITGSVAGLRLAGRGWMLEPDAEALGQRMRWVISNPDSARAKGLAASAHVRSEWTWEKAAKICAARARDLKLGRSETIESVSSEEKVPVMTLPQSTSPAVANLGNLTSAQALFAKGLHIQAAEEVSRALRIRPFHPAAWLLLAEIALSANDATQARRCIARACAMAPQWKPGKAFLSRPLKGEVRRDWPKLPEPSPSPRLSVCLITRNEERFLDRCLTSIKEVASQIVVVDTGSTDRTIEIAKQHGAEVHAFKWCDDFSAARNAALEHATGDWILILDADEELSADGLAKLRRDLANAAVMAYRLPLVDVGREAEGCHYIPRLFRNAPGLHFTGRIHEQLFPSLEPLRQEFGRENKFGAATLLHHGYTAEVTESRHKIERNTRLLRLAVAEAPNDPNLLMNLGLELTRAGQAQAGLEAYDQAWLALTKQSPDMTPGELRETLLLQYGTYLLRAGSLRQLIDLFETPQGRATEGNASLHFLRGMAFLKLSRWKEAVEQMARCLARRDEPSLTTIHADICTVAPRHCLALAQAQMKDLDAAGKSFAAALAEAAPDNFAVQFDYAGFLFAIGGDVEALQQLHQLAERKPDEVTVWQSGAKVALSRPDFLEVALDWTATAHTRFPNDAVIATQRAEALLRSGNAEAARLLWGKFRNPIDPVHTAAHLICETAMGQSGSQVPAAMQDSVAKEVLVWFKLLVAGGAEKVIQELDTNLELLRAHCPNAAGRLHEIFAQTQQDAVAA